MSRLVAAALILLAQEMPVTQLAGGGPGPGVPAAQTAPQRPAPSSLPVTQLDPGAFVATLDSPRRLSLQFSEPRPLPEVLRLLMEGTPFSLAMDADVTGTFRGELKQLTLRDAL